MTVIRGWSLAQVLRNKTHLSDDPRAFEIQPNQRDYAWVLDEQVTDLLNDLLGHIDETRRNSPDEPYVLGSIILCPGSHEATPSGAALDTLRSYEVIDGQQRLLTLVALLSALRSVATTQNLRHMADTLEPVLGGISFRHHEAAMQNLITTVLAATFRTDLARIVAEESDSATEESDTRSASNFANVVQGLYEQLTALHSEDSSLLAALCDLTLHRTLFAVTLTGSSESALLAFERANNRGKGLDVTDLIKNYTFMMSRPETPHERGWGRWIDDEWKKSRSIVESSQVNINFADLIRWHHRAHATGTIDLRGSNLYRKVQAELQTFAGTGVDYVTALKQSARWVASVHRLGERSPGDKIDGLLGLKMIRGQTKMQQHIPVLLAAAKWDDAAFSSLARRLEALSFVAIVCKVRPQEIERTYNDVFAHLKASKGDAEDRQTAALEALRLKTSQLSLERDFATAVSRLRYSKSSEVKLIRYICTRIDGALESSTRGEPLSMWDNLRNIAWPSKPTAKSLRDHLDHVHPKSLLKDWEYDPSLIDSIGNLVLWPGRQNSGAGATPAATKLAENYRSSTGNCTRYLVAVGPENFPDHEWAQDTGLKQAKRWTSAEIHMLASFYARAMGSILEFEVGVVQ